MLLTQMRFASNSSTTLSLIYIDGVFECFCLEDSHRTKKIPGKTRIPAGIYKVGVREYGSFHQRYQERFREHRGMLEILAVPGFSDILIHVGNYHTDTAGCLLLGQTATWGDDVSIGNSALAYVSLYSKVIRYAYSDQLSIRIIDNDIVNTQDIDNV